jgi:hypothetical protein
MDWLKDRLCNIGGGFGGIMAYILNITPMHIIEIGFYGLIGSLIGEGVKLLFERQFKKKKTDGE